MIVDLENRYIWQRTAVPNTTNSHPTSNLTNTLQAYITKTLISLISYKQWFHIMDKVTGITNFHLSAALILACVYRYIWFSYFLYFSLISFRYKIETSISKGHLSYLILRNTALIVLFASWLVGIPHFLGLLNLFIPSD